MLHGKASNMTGEEEDVVADHTSDGSILRRCRCGKQRLLREEESPVIYE